MACCAEPFMDVLHKNTVNIVDKIQFVQIPFQATLCCLSGIQDPPKSAEILEHAAGNVFSILYMSVRCFCSSYVQFFGVGIITEA